MQQTDKEALLQALHRLKKSNSWCHTQAGMSRGEFFLLHKIYHMSKDLCTETGSESPGVKISDLSVAAEMSKPAVSQMLNSLENKKMVMRSMTKSDRRVVYVLLTEEGKQKLKQASQEMNDLFEQIVRELGPKDTAELTRLINKLYKIIEKMSENS